jgi:hypothetical protein
MNPLEESSFWSARILPLKEQCKASNKVLSRMASIGNVQYVVRHIDLRTIFVQRY